MNNTSIEWTDVTWNPTRGCSRISEGCRFCYAEKIAGRFSTHALQLGDQDAGVFAGFAIMKNGEAHWTGKVELIESKLMEPLHWRKPRRAFVNSMSDLFHEKLPTRDIIRVFAVMTLTPWITYQVLTKRADRLPMVIDAQFEHDVKGCAWEMLGRMPKFNHQYLGSNAMTRPWPLPNVHLGVSIEDQPTADSRIPMLLQTPAAIRFVSYEPALAPVTFINRPVTGCSQTRRNWLNGEFSNVPFRNRTQEFTMTISTNPRLDQVIIGGESGPGARPFRLSWARNSIGECKEARVPAFMKQVGSRPIGENAQDLVWLAAMKDRKGGDMEEWSEDLRIRQSPGFYAGAAA